jgi:Family of unknown function (DUF5941)
MSAAAATGRAVSAPRSRLDAYRDDGPLSRALGRLLGPVVPFPALVLTVLAVVPPAVVLALGRASVSPAALGAALGLSVLAGGIASGRPHTGRLIWLVPSLLRTLEYGALLWFAVLAGPHAVPFCFALVAVLAFHHYDTVYRLRHQGAAPPRWILDAGGGWDGRLLVACLLLVLGALPSGFLVAAVALAVAYVAESAASWLRFTQAQRPALYADEEDEDE